MDSVATFLPALQGWQTLDDYELSIHILHSPCSSLFATLGCQQSAHELHSVLDYSLGFEPDCQDTPAFTTGGTFPATVAADTGPSVIETQALPAPAVATMIQHISVPIITTCATGPAGKHGAGPAAQKQQKLQDSQSAASTDFTENGAHQQHQQTQQNASGTAPRSKELQISSVGFRIKKGPAPRPVQKQQSHSAAAHHQTEVQQITEDKLKVGERCKIDTDRKLDWRQSLEYLKKGNACSACVQPDKSSSGITRCTNPTVNGCSISCDHEPRRAKACWACVRPEYNSSGTTSCTTPNVSGCSISDDLECKCPKKQEAAWAASAEVLAAAAVADDNDDIELFSSSGYSQQQFWNYYVKIDVVDPETNSKTHLDLSTVCPKVELNGRNRGGRKARNIGQLHAVRKICRALRAALSPQAEETWRNLGLKHKDSRGDLNLSDCHSFLESILTGQDTCPYLQSTNAKAAQWADNNNVWGYLWPQDEELCLPGVVTYLARLVSWGLGRVVRPATLNDCFNKGGNGYKTIDQDLTKLGAYLWNWPLPLTKKAHNLQLVKAYPPRQLLPANRASRGPRPNSAAASVGVAAGCWGERVVMHVARGNSPATRGKRQYMMMTVTTILSTGHLLEQVPGQEPSATTPIARPLP